MDIYFLEYSKNLEIIFLRNITKTLLLQFFSIWKLKDLIQYVHFKSLDSWLRDSTVFNSSCWFYFCFEIFFFFFFLNSPDFFFHQKIQPINVKEKNSKVSQLEDSETICWKLTEHKLCSYVKHMGENCKLWMHQLLDERFYQATKIQSWDWNTKVMAKELLTTMLNFWDIIIFVYVKYLLEAMQPLLIWLQIKLSKLLWM